MEKHRSINTASIYFLFSTKKIAEQIIAGYSLRIYVKPVGVRPALTRPRESREKNKIISYLNSMFRFVGLVVEL